MLKCVSSASNTPEWQPTELVNVVLSRGARDVVWQWISQDQFLDNHKQPRSLFFRSPYDADFNSLVNQVQADLVPVVVFNELLRKDIVVQHDQGRLLLRRSAYMPGGRVHCVAPFQGDLLIGNVMAWPSLVGKGL